MKKKFLLNNKEFQPGEIGQTKIGIGNDSLGREISIEILVINGIKEGPTIGCFGAIHGDELNGTGILHHLSQGFDHLSRTSDDLINPKSLSGALILVPLANPSAVLSGTRYGPDGRDLNRQFPGNKKGNWSRRLAHTLFHQIVIKCDMIVDLHTAPSSRLNIPHIRVDLENKKAKKMAQLFGLQLILHSKGSNGTLRNAAMEYGIPTILLEAGTSHKFEPEMVRLGLRGLLELFSGLNMIEKRNKICSLNLIVKKSRWIRSTKGGLLHLSVDGGDIVDIGDEIGTIVNPLGEKTETILSPVEGIIIGLTTLPTIDIGSPIANIVLLDKNQRTILEKQGVEGIIDAAMDVTEIIIEDEDGLAIDDLS